MGKLDCKLCNRKFKNYQGITSHIRRTHNINSKEYYDLYFKTTNEEICNNPKCNNFCGYSGFNHGYYNYCCRSCKNKSKEARQNNKLSTQKMWNNLNSSYHTKNRNDKIRKKFKKLWACQDSIFRTKEYKVKKSNTLKKLHKDPNSGYNSKQYKKFRSEYMKNGGSANCHRFIKNPSKPQVELFQLCQNIVPYPILNYPCLSYSIDIAIPSLNLAIEYDGSYWHQNKEYDLYRQEQIEKEGWKFLRCVDYIPNKQELLKNINEVLKNV